MTDRPTSSTAPRQTLGYLRNLFQAHGIHPKNKLGQNFLIDLNLVDVILGAAELTRDDLVLEVGSGTGSLTARLAEQAGRVLTVEIDHDFVKLTERAVAGRRNVTVLNADILKKKNQLNSGVLEKLRELATVSACSNLKLIANLPYAVATPVISNILLSDFRFERMLVMVQLEIAERLMAQPGCKEYGALAVLVQSIADVEVVRPKIPPAVFWPRPKVSSSMIMVRPNVAKRAHVGDVTRFRHFLRDLYTQRRKNIRGALSGLPSGRIEKAEVDRKLAELGVPGTVRAEELDVECHLRLCGAFGEAALGTV
jgi:16S rRNA (adenine1518-N6/adenine1519-N6)-dimethyltransferase